MDKEQLNIKIRDILDLHTYMKLDEQGNFTTELYTDYTDTLGDDQFKKWFNEKNPREAFQDDICEWYREAQWQCEDDLKKIVINHWGDKLDDETEDYILEWISEHVDIEYPFKHFLDQTVCIDIIVDTGDGNYDYTLNCVYPHYDGTYGEAISDEAAITWLTKQQGYKKSQLNKALRKEEFDGSKFLKSLRTEIHNCSTHMNALTFFVQLTLEECFDLWEAIRKEKADNRKGYLELSTLTPCGLYDCWNGAGSVLEVTLEKNVQLPLKYISSAWPDGCRGYGADQIYGMNDSFWQPTLEKAVIL